MIGGRPHVDGGVINNAPISHAVQWGATTVYVLPTGYSCALRQDVKSALGVALQAMNLLVQRRLGEDIANYQDLIDSISLAGTGTSLPRLTRSPVSASHRFSVEVSHDLPAGRVTEECESCD